MEFWRSTFLLDWRIIGGSLPSLGGDILVGTASSDESTISYTGKFVKEFSSSGVAELFFVSFTCVFVEDSAGLVEIGHFVVVFCSAGMMLIWHRIDSSSSRLMLSSKNTTLRLLFASRGLKVLSSCFKLINDSEKFRSSSTSLHGKTSSYPFLILNIGDVRGNNHRLVRSEVIW